MRVGVVWAWAPICAWALLCAAPSLADVRAERRYVRACEKHRVSPHADVVEALREDHATIAPGRHASRRDARRFGDHDALALVDALRGESRVRFLCFRGRGCALGHVGAASIAGLLHGGGVEQVDLSHNNIGSRGGSALARALPHAKALTSLRLRACGLRRDGANALADHVEQRAPALRHLDASNNYAGFLATRRLERLGRDVLRVDAEGNRVSAEVLSVLTHGAGLCLSVGAAVGLLRLSPRIADGRVRLGVKVFAMSLLVLYTSSTAFHAAFLQASARHVLHVFDQCAIYVLICGTYFPIMAAVGTPAAAGALAAVATLGGVGIGLEVFCHAARKRKRKWLQVTSLGLYVAMGWATVFPPVLRGVRLLSGAAYPLLIGGGVAYTAGVPLFARNAYVDHAIWHLFVLAGSACHYFAVLEVIRPFLAPIVAPILPSAPPL